MLRESGPADLVDDLSLGAVLPEHSGGGSSEVDVLDVVADLLNHAGLMRYMGLGVFGEQIHVGVHLRQTALDSRLDSAQFDRSEIVITGGGPEGVTQSLSAIDTVGSSLCRLHQLSGGEGAGVNHQTLEGGLGARVDRLLVLDIHDLNGDQHAAGVKDSGALMVGEGSKMFGDHNCFSFQFVTW